jgi:hypothetical protein
VTGDVVRWTDINPGADGTFTIDMNPEITSPSNLAYLSGIRLTAIALTVPEPSGGLVAMLGLLGLCCVGWRRRQR